MPDKTKKLPVGTYLSTSWGSDDDWLILAYLGGRVDRMLESAMRIPVGLLAWVLRREE